MSNEVDSGSPITGTLSPEDDLLLRIVDRIAEEEDSDPLELPPLSYAIDMEALRKIIASGSSAQTRVFTYCGYQIKVSGTREFSVRST